MSLALPTINDVNATVPGLFARRSINLLIGTPHCGRSRFALTQLDSYLGKSSFLDYPLGEGQKPEACGAICCARTFDDMFYKIREMQLHSLQAPHAFPIETWDPFMAKEDGLDLLDGVYERLSNAATQPIKLLFIEGFQRLQASGKVNDAQAVGDHFRRLQEFCSTNDCTILGTVGTAKMKNGESYPLLAHRVLGSGQWTESANTLLGLAEMDAHLPANRRSLFRELTIQTPGSRPRVIYLDFDRNGSMVPKITPSADDNSAEAALDAMLQTKAPGEQFTRQETLDWGTHIKCSEKTVDRWRADRIELGFIEKSGNTNKTLFWRPIPN